MLMFVVDQHYALNRLKMVLIVSTVALDFYYNSCTVACRALDSLFYTPYLHNASSLLIKFLMN
jgi:hypothetical protein